MHHIVLHLCPEESYSFSDMPFSDLLTCSLRHLLACIVFYAFSTTPPPGVCWEPRRTVRITVCLTDVVAFFYVGCHLGRLELQALCTVHCACVCVCVFVHTCGAKHQEIVVLVQMSQPGAELELFYYIKHMCNQYLLACLAQEDGRKVTELQVFKSVWPTSPN